MQRRNRRILSVVSLLIFGLSFAIQPVSAGIGDWFYDNDGVVNPDSNYQRYRGNEYSTDSPFFQWWYFCIKDLANNTYWAFDYSLSRTVTNKTNEGSYMMFCSVDKQTDTNFQKYEKFPISSLTVNNDFDVKITNTNYAIHVINNDTYHVTGTMNNTGNVWYANGCPDNLYVKWDLTIYRIFGWYGQQDAESTIKSYGLISWDTYAHDAEVEGYITVGNTTYTISRNSNFRAYCDENWGENFPSGSPSIDYPWGWYYASLPNTDPTQDVSIIAGSGRCDTGSILGTCLGKYADVELTDSTHIGFRQNEIWSEAYSLMDTCNDGDLQSFDITRDNWTTYTDDLGSAQIPLYQKVYMQSDHYMITMEFFSKLSDYNRLLFPTENYVFSDFEGLGVSCHIQVTYYWATYAWYDIIHCDPTWHYQSLYNFWSDDGGLEYGYNVDIA